MNQIQRRIILYTYIFTRWYR